ncbi:MAG: hypothetical protein DI598_08080, partial [Pseudopedobacter saltans]
FTIRSDAISSFPLRGIFRQVLKLINKEKMKKLQYTIYSIALLIMSNVTMAQKTEFLTKGKIIFEKKLNIYAQMQEIFKGNENSSWIDDVKDYFKKNNGQFLTTQYSLTFDGDKTLFKSIPSDDAKPLPWFVYNDEDNSTYSDFGKDETVRLRHIYEDFFLVTDSSRQINWKITNETREIAGINCRRANAVIMDSVYVVAFYTDDIVTPGGPESFNGLPGMILGVALPYDHVSWFATKVTTEVNPAKDLVPPSKGKKLNTKSYVDDLGTSLKNWGNRGKSIIKTTLF